MLIVSLVFALIRTFSSILLNCFDFAELLRDALTATVRYYFCIGPDSELRCLFCGHYCVVRFENLFNCS